MTQNIKCPTCGRNDFERTSDMKRHHASIHGESIAGVELTCENCGETYRQKPHKTERSSFCSEECHAEYRSSHWTGENAPNWRGGKKTLTCENCGEEYEVIPAEAKRGSRFCSRPCMYEYARKTGRFSRDNHPRWKGGSRPKYDGDWSGARKRARKRDEYECQLCGLSENDTDGQLDVHHIVPVREFDNPQNAHNLDNLVSLCRSCHFRLEPLTETEQREKLRIEA